MASIKKLEGKTGTSYKITVTRGRDSSGKQIRHYKTWVPDHPMTARQMEKEVQRVAIEFEREIELGYQADNRQTFEQFAEYFIQLRERAGAAPNTIHGYRFFLERINPELRIMKLKDIRPAHLNKFYGELAKENVRKGKVYAQAKVDIVPILKEKGLTYAEIAQQFGGNQTTISRACRGYRVKAPAAKSVADALGGKLCDYFTTESDVSKLSNTTIHAFHTFIHNVFKQAERELIIPYNPASRASPPQEDTPEAEYFTAEELIQILECLKNEPIKWRTITTLLIVTGCRRGEIMGLKWNKVDFENSRIKIDTCLSYLPEKGVYEGPTKTRHNRYVTVPSETMALLQKYRRWQVEQQFKYGDSWIQSDYVFTKRGGGAVGPDTITKWLTTFSKKYGIKHAHPHMFRHTQATLLISNGVDVTTVSKRLGHANTSTTVDIYSHLYNEAEKQASERIADITIRKKRA